MNPSVIINLSSINPSNYLSSRLWWRPLSQHSGSALLLLFSPDGPEVFLSPDGIRGSPAPWDLLSTGGGSPKGLASVRCLHSTQKNTVSTSKLPQDLSPAHFISYCLPEENKNIKLWIHKLKALKSSGWNLLLPTGTHSFPLPLEHQQQQSATGHVTLQA